MALRRRIEDPDAIPLGPVPLRVFFWRTRRRRSDFRQLAIGLVLGGLRKVEDKTAVSASLELPANHVLGVHTDRPPPLRRLTPASPSTNK